MKKPASKKIEMDELLELKRSGRRTYMVLPGILVAIYHLKPGDVLKVRIKEVIREEGPAPRSRARSTSNC